MVSSDVLDIRCSLRYRESGKTRGGLTLDALFQALNRPILVVNAELTTSNVLYVAWKAQLVEHPTFQLDFPLEDVAEILEWALPGDPLTATLLAIEFRDRLVTIPSILSNGLQTLRNNSSNSVQRVEDEINLAIAKRL